MPHDPNNPRFFIALIPPQAIQDYANQVIQELGDRFQMGTAKAPPHVTLQAPFQWPLSQVEALEGCLQQQSQSFTSVPVQIQGFGVFAPRVLYLNVLKTAELLMLQANLAIALETHLGIVDAKSKTRSFAPHLTVASRNVTRETFKQAWADLKTRSVELEWLSDRLMLLIHDGQRWQVRSDFPLQAATASNSSSTSSTLA